MKRNVWLILMLVAILGGKVFAQEKFKLDFYHTGNQSLLCSGVKFVIGMQVREGNFSCEKYSTLRFADKLNWEPDDAVVWLEYGVKKKSWVRFIVPPEIMQFAAVSGEISLHVQVTGMFTRPANIPSLVLTSSSATPDYQIFPVWMNVRPLEYTPMNRPSRHEWALDLIKERGYKIDPHWRNFFALE